MFSVSTQNANESLNGVIWRRCPKAQWFGKESVKVAAIMGVISFNSGETQLTTIAEKFGLAVGANTAKHAKSKDEKRARREVPESGERKNRKHRQVKERQRLIQKEGVTYAAGRFGDGLLCEFVDNKYSIFGVDRLFSINTIFSPWRICGVWSPLTVICQA